MLSPLRLLPRHVIVDSVQPLLLLCLFWAGDKDVEKASAGLDAQYGEDVSLRLDPIFLLLRFGAARCGSPCLAESKGSCDFYSD